MIGAETNEGGEEVELSRTVNIDTIPKDGGDALFLFYSGLTELNFDVELVDYGLLDEDGMGILEVEASTDGDAEIARSLKSRFHISPMGRMIVDISDGFYKPFMPEDRYQSGDTTLTMRHLNLAPIGQRPAFLSAYGRHLLIRERVAKTLTPLELVNRLGQFTVDRGAMEYERQLRMGGAVPFTIQQLFSHTKEEIRRDAKYLGIEVSSVGSDQI